MIELSIQDHLEVAHFMPDFPEGHRNRRLHGHSYVLTLTLRSEEDVDMIMELDELQTQAKAVTERYCHTSVNDWDLPRGKPTMENMCLFLFRKYKEVIPQLHRITLARPTLNMTVTYEASK